MWFKEHFLTVTIVPLLVLLIASSYYRFVIQRDYLVSYEGDCDPMIQSCYIGCIDDDCMEEYYYSVIERRASEVRLLCGDDVSICDDAYECQAEVEECNIYFCDPTIDGSDACYFEDNTDTL